jgi:hypothetical protein
MTSSMIDDISSSVKRTGSPPGGTTAGGVSSSAHLAARGRCTSSTRNARAPMGSSAAGRLPPRTAVMNARGFRPD